MNQHWDNLYSQTQDLYGISPNHFIQQIADQVPIVGKTLAIAVGFGVNIQAANHVIHYTRSWNPAKEDQATDRAYRIGQQKEVYVYYPTISAPDWEELETFEVKLDRLLGSKRVLATDMLQPKTDVSKELMQLID
nr:C-terminal helicase domain-containing protein [Acinetobacter sp. YH12144]